MESGLIFAMGMIAVERPARKISTFNLYLLTNLQLIIFIFFDCKDT
jgi:hypothetical protein